MSKVLKQSKAVLVMALMYNDINIYNSALEKLINNFGEIEVVSDEYLFSHSAYYKDEMGDSLNKRFITSEDAFSKSLPIASAFALAIK